MLYTALRKCTFENRFFEKGENYELSEGELKNVGSEFKPAKVVEDKTKAPKKDPKKEAEKATKEDDKGDKGSEGEGGKAKRK